MPKIKCRVEGVGTRMGSTRGRLRALGLMGYKYELGCVQVTSDHSPDTMRLLALLLMVGAAGKEKEILTMTKTCQGFQKYDVS